MNEEMRKEAIRRLSNLVDKYDLNPNILKYFKQGKLYYSYAVVEGIMGSIDTINYDERYAEAVKEFENRTHNLVYHAIETGNTLALLFVSHYTEDWEAEDESNHSILAFIKNFDTPEYSEIGYIYISSYNGVLTRIG